VYAINRHCIWSHILPINQQTLHIQSQALPINQQVIFIQSTYTVYSHKHCILINRHCIYSHRHCLLISNQYLYSHRHVMTMCDSWYIITSQLLRCYYISGITHCHSCSWYTRIVQVIILFFLFIFSNSRDILKWTVHCYWRNGWLIAILLIIVIILGILPFRRKKGSIYTPFNMTHKDTLFLNFMSHVINVAYCCNCWVTIPCIPPPLRLFVLQIAVDMLWCSK
jgi:hypothetical protein